MVQESGLLEMTEDWRLLVLARRGDSAAWRDLYRLHYAPVVRMAASITGSIDSAHDLAQESFVRLLGSTIRHYNGTLRSFLTTISYRLALKERRRTSAATDVDTLAIDSGQFSPLEETIRNETARKILGVIQTLPLPQREILALRFFAEQSYEEIAEVTGLPIGTVKSRLFYAVKACREGLIASGVFR